MPIIMIQKRGGRGKKEHAEKGAESKHDNTHMERKTAMAAVAKALPGKKS